ncbi:MAG: hypothetical protein PUF36_04435 [Prevotella sp.]|nr:hypothetical protein [Prevotella sp.]MDY2805968.1 hypothetical protein [Prevotella sp.]
MSRNLELMLAAASQEEDNNNSIVALEKAGAELRAAIDALNSAKQELSPLEKVIFTKTCH